MSTTYRLELCGFQNFKRVPCADLEAARAAWTAVKAETFTVESLGQKHEVNWSTWELYQAGVFEPIKQGAF